MGGLPLLSSSDSLLSHVEQLLRAFILKISVCDAVLDHNPPGVLPSYCLFPGCFHGYLGLVCVLKSPFGCTEPRPFLPFRTPLKVYSLQEASLVDPTLASICLLTVS